MQTFSWGCFCLISCLPSFDQFWTSWGNSSPSQSRCRPAQKVRTANLKRITRFCGWDTKLIHLLSAKARIKNQPKVRTQRVKIAAELTTPRPKLQSRVTRTPGDGRWTIPHLALRGAVAPLVQAERSVVRGVPRCEQRVIQQLLAVVSQHYCKAGDASPANPYLPSAGSVSVGDAESSDYLSLVASIQ